MNNLFSNCIIVPNKFLDLFFYYGKYNVTNDLKNNLENYFNEKSDIDSYFNLISLINKNDKSKLYTLNFNNELNKKNMRCFLIRNCQVFEAKVLRFELEIHHTILLKKIRSR